MAGLIKSLNITDAILSGFTVCILITLYYMYIHITSLYNMHGHVYMHIIQRNIHVHVHIYL